jgi:activator-of-BECN1-regulated-autophagy protein 1
LLKHELSRDPPIGNVIRACRLAGPKASGVTCVKFSPSADYCLLGYGVRENAPQGGDRTPHPVTAVYGSNREHTSDDGSMTSPESQLVHVTTLRSSEDDVNIARFHPESGHGFVYGTKQGRVRVLDPRPWNYYYA